MMCEERTAVSLFWGGRLFCVWRISSHRNGWASCPVPESTTRKNKSAQHSTSKTQAYRKQIGTAPHIQNPSIQQTNRHSAPHPKPKHTDTSQHPSLLHNQELLKKSPRGVQRGRGFAAPLRFFFLHKKIAPTSQRCKS